MITTEGSPDSLKRQWQKPQLVVLVRSRPEEAVLLACKHGGHAGPSDNNCKVQNVDCQTFSRS